MEAPKGLRYKPIIAVNDYNTIDEIYASNSDAKALLTGQAQYDEDEISAKVYRHTGHNWSRQSEELPIHRVPDLAVFIIASMQSSPGDKKPVSNLGEIIVNHARHQELLDYYKKNKKLLQSKIAELKKILSKI